MSDFPDELAEITLRLAERERELLRFWNLSSDILVILSRDSQGGVTIDKTSPSVESLLGWGPEELEGQELSALTAYSSPQFSEGGNQNLKMGWKSKPSSGLPETVELEWTSSPWVSAEKGEEKCYAVARPLPKNGFSGRSSTNGYQGWSPTVRDNGISPIRFASDKKR